MSKRDRVEMALVWWGVLIICGVVWFVVGHFVWQFFAGPR